MRCGRLRETSGAIGVAELAAETGLSARRLGSLFQAEIGLAPKESGRVFRFDHARRRIMNAVGGGGTLACLAAECGYYDQAHLAREFRSLAGCPPSQWLAEESGQRLDEEFRFVQAAPADLPEGSWA